MRIRLAQTLSQKQILAPSMQQSIEVLLLPILDLQLAIEQELENNPLLEIPEEAENEKDETLPTFARELYERLEKFIEIPSPASYGHDNEPAITTPSPVSREETLEDILLRQLRVETSDPRDIEIGEFIIGNISEDGYLKATFQEITHHFGLPDTRQIERVLALIQSFDPPGIAARSLKECLILQLKRQGHKNPLAELIINEYLEELGARKLALIARQTDSPLEKIKQAAQLISTLEPRPARNYRPIQPNIYIQPDVFVWTDEEENYHVALRQETLPVLRINPLYRQIFKHNNLKPEEKEFFRQKLKDANYFIKSIQQRGRTIKQIVEFIVERQKNFFKEENGTLIPMTLRDVALRLERNESTISRAVSGKYMETPRGLFPMKFFFSQAVGGNGGNGGHTPPEQTDPPQTVSNRSVKEEIKELINKEDSSSPLSDRDIQDYFKQKGLVIARRTITKYRQILHILPTHLRKK